MEDSKIKEKASYYFHHPEFKFNCAQAIVHKWGSDESLVDQMRRYGGGKATDGNCGALHGALTVLKEKSLKEKMLSLFKDRAGSNRCKYIKQVGKISCIECVDIADQILQEIQTATTNK